MVKLRGTDAEAGALQVRIEGFSLDIPMRALETASVVSDRELKGALARYLDVPVHEFEDYIVDRRDPENLTMRLAGRMP